MNLHLHIDPQSGLPVYRQMIDQIKYYIASGTLKPGDHPTVTKIHNYEFKYDEVRWSTDGLYYACLYPTEYTLRCLYLPPPSF